MKMETDVLKEQYYSGLIIAGKCFLLQTGTKSVKK